MYATPAQLIDGPQALQEFAELFDINHALLAATIAGDDRSGYSADEIAAADRVLVSLLEIIRRADGEIDSRLATRGYPLPQNPVQFPVLAVWGIAIARYHANRSRDKTDEERGRIERDYRDALRALDLVAAGKLSLGAGDPLASGSADAAVMWQSQPRLFDRQSLGRL